jgi:hypothetical protein
VPGIGHFLGEVYYGACHVQAILCQVRCLRGIWGRLNFGTCREMVTMVGTGHYVMAFMDLYNGQVDLHNAPVDLHNSLLYPL